MDDSVLSEIHSMSGISGDDESINIDETINDSKSVIENSLLESNLSKTAEDYSEAVDDSVANMSNSSEDEGDSSKITISGSESEESDDSFKPHNIEDDSDDSVEENKNRKSTASKVYILDSSDESATEQDKKYETNVKVETVVDVKPNVKMEREVKFDSMQQSSQIGSSAAVLKPINPSQLIDDVKPIFTGKTGMETFNNQQYQALNCMKTFCKSLESKPDENEIAENPKQLKVELMAHQRSALTWMLWREQQKPRGGILADDMGLGKTMSMISLVVVKRYQEEDEKAAGESSNSSEDEDEVDNKGSSSWMTKGQSNRQHYYGGTLVVCPASIMDQWKNEVKNRLKRDSLNVVLHHGSNRETRPKMLSKVDMVITTYGIVSSESDNDGPLFSVKWERIILDEAHIIRNHTSKQSLACCRLKGSARWALTGTPIQNKEADLYSLLKFLKCRPFDDYSSFKMWISKTSTKSQERMNQVLQTLLLRRTKEDLKSSGQVDSLPEKHKEIVAVKLSTDEMNVYQKVLTYSQTLFSEYLHQRETRNNFSIPTTSDKKNEWVQLHQQISRASGTEAISGHHILILILRLRQICIHPCLIDAMLADGDYDGGDSDAENAPDVDLLQKLSQLEINENSGGVSKAAYNVLLRSNPVFNEDRISSKFQKIIEYLSEKLIPSGDKGIVVSQFASVLNMFGQHLKNIGIKFVMLTGSTKIESRNEIVTHFNSSTSSVQVMLLSLTAGGVGLNLVGANHLFFVDPHWNPQLESQAQDRIYRLGQKKPVTVYKFLCDDTIERRIQHLQESKLQVAEQILTGTKRSATKLTLQDMKRLFDL